MKASKKHFSFTQWCFTLCFTILFLQSCNTPSHLSDQVMPKLNSSRINANDKKEWVSYTRKIDSFKELLKLQDEHIVLHKSKKAKIKLLSEQEQTIYKNQLEKAKTKQDLIDAFSLANTNPNEVYDFLQNMCFQMFILKHELLSLGIDNDLSNDLIITAVKEEQKSRADKYKSSKLDCYGVCSGNLNLAMSAVNSNFDIAIISCLLGGFGSSAGAIFAGAAFTPVLIPLYALLEVACIGGVYYSYSVAFNLAIQGFDVCTSACA